MKDNPILIITQRRSSQHPVLYIRRNKSSKHPHDQTTPYHYLEIIALRPIVRYDQSKQGFQVYTYLLFDICSK